MDTGSGNIYLAAVATLLIAAWLTGFLPWVGVTGCFEGKQDG